MYQAVWRSAYSIKSLFSTTFSPFFFCYWLHTSSIFRPFVIINLSYRPKQQKHLDFLRGRQIYITDSLSFFCALQMLWIWNLSQFQIYTWNLCSLLTLAFLRPPQILTPTCIKANVVFLVICYQSVQSDPKMFYSTHAQSAIKDPDLRASSSGSANLLFVPQDNQADASLCHFFGRKSGNGGLPRICKA